MLTITKGRSLRDGIESGRDRFQLSREGLESLGREGLQAGREGLHAGREGIQTIGSSMADLAEVLPMRRKRRRSFPLIGAIFVAIVGAVAIALIVGLQTRREGGPSFRARSKTGDEFDHDPIGKSADEGMAVGASAADDLVGRANGREPFAEVTGRSRPTGV